MDENRLLTLIVVRFSQDSEVLQLALVCRDAYRACEFAVDAANNRRLGVKFQQLREHTGGDTTREAQAEQDARDFEFWATHVAADWDFSDD